MGHVSASTHALDHAARPELERFVANLDKGMAADPRYVEINRLALDNICKKFDKRNRKRACWHSLPGIGGVSGQDVSPLWSAVQVPKKGRKYRR